MLAALAYEARLEIFRFLVRAGPEGAAAGQIAEGCGIQPSTLSHHLNQLVNAGLISRARAQRSLIYSANFETFDGLLGYLADECCNGQPGQCLPARQGAAPDQVN